MLSISQTMAKLNFYVGNCSDSGRQVWNSLRPVSTEFSLWRAGTKDGDGGYLIPELTHDLVMSAGIADNADFELELARLYKCEVHMIDASISSPPVHHDNFRFLRYFLGPKTFGDYISLTDWLKISQYSGKDILLKLDIEGAEYESLIATEVETLARFKTIVIEFHSTEQISTNLGAKLMGIALEKLKANHTLVHLHGNNFAGTWDFPRLSLPTSLELTFLRSDSISQVSDYQQIPAQQDKPSDPTRREFRPIWA
jgi:hypothetical protein